MENNRECNHCSANHPELTVPLLEYGFGYQPTPENISKMKEFEELLAREHRKWEACGLPSIAIDVAEQDNRLPRCAAADRPTWRVADD